MPEKPDDRASVPGPDAPSLEAWARDLIAICEGRFSRRQCQALNLRGIITALIEECQRLRDAVAAKDGALLRLCATMRAHWGPRDHCADCTSALAAAEAALSPDAGREVAELCRRSDFVEESRRRYMKLHGEDHLYREAAEPLVVAVRCAHAAWCEYAEDTEAAPLALVSRLTLNMLSVGDALAALAALAAEKGAPDATQP